MYFLKKSKHHDKMRETCYYGHALRAGTRGRMTGRTDGREGRQEKTNYSASFSPVFPPGKRKGTVSVSGQTPEQFRRGGFLMKKRLGAAAVVLGVLLLTACGTADQKKASGTGEQPSQSVSGTAQGEMAAPTQPQGGGEAPVQGGTAQTEAPVEETQEASIPTIDTQTEAPAGETDMWSGTYVGENDTVTLSKTSETALYFAFAQSGISGTAELNGYQAVYRGDDHHVVVFNINGTILDVSVSSEEDFDASGSPLIGTYVREG